VSSYPSDFSNWVFKTLAFPLVTTLALGMFLVASPAMAAGSQQELQFDPASKSWVKRPAGSLRENANRKWANASPVAAEVVPFKTEAKPGTIIIRTAERRLYLVRKDGMAKKYGIGVGREGFSWTGSEKITRKAEWPSWTPPAEMKLREAAKGRVLPDSMEGGRDNPMGARALYLGATAYRIHGTNEPWTIGSAVSSGCIRMANEDIIDLYSQAKIGTVVRVE
jgi:lipoprotein-anchoring transpeptidase ErfK/SrfK